MVHEDYPPKASPMKYPDFIREEMEEVRTLLGRLINDGIEGFLPAGYPLLEGKMIRPSLLLSVNRIYGNSKEGVRYATAVELIHLASLVHDDILDRASMRRGEKSLHLVMGEREALLVGDYLYSKAIEISLEGEIPPANRTISKAVSNMVAGEIKARLLSGKIDLALEDYEDITMKKTALLFSASAELGSIINGASEEEKKRMEGFGYNLGMLFQISDDILDYMDDGPEAGKDKFNDFRNGQVTLPLILLLKEAGKTERDRCRELFDRGNGGDGEMEFLKRLLEKYPVMEGSLRFIDHYMSGAGRYLSGLPPSDERDYLYRLLKFVAGRVFRQ